MNKEDRVNFAPVEKMEDLVNFVATTTVVDGAKSGKRSGEVSSIEGLCDCQRTGENNMLSHSSLRN